jgi:hypothetical protein
LGLFYATALIATGLLEPRNDLVFAFGVSGLAIIFCRPQNKKLVVESCYFAFKNPQWVAAVALFLSIVVRFQRT